MAINDKKRATLFLDPVLLKQSKMQAVIKEISLSSLMEEALLKYLTKEKKKGGEKIWQKL